MQPAPSMASKHYRAFWPLTIIIMLSVIVAGLIIWLAYNDTLDSEIYSLVPGIHKVTAVKKCVPTVKTKCPTQTKY